MANPVTYRKDAELDRLGVEALRRWHSAKMRDARFQFVFRSKPRSRRGAMVVATASVVPDRLRQLGWPADYIIEVAEPAWVALSPEQRLAVLDHELMHCEPVRNPETGAVSYLTVGHDFEDFVEIVRRHGCYLPHHTHVQDAYLQAELPFDESAEVTAGGVPDAAASA